jgi:hypothetical protein
VPYRKRKKPHRGIGTHVGAMCPIAPNALWALDVQFDTTVDGRILKLLNVVDELTRECPAIVVDRSIDADKVVATLDKIAGERAAPAFVRFDNGPEFIARAVADWCRFNDVDAVFIDPGSPWQNAWIESFNSRLRDEFLNGWHFDNLLEAQVLIEELAHRLQRQPPAQRARRSHPERVRASVDQPKPTSTRITPGPLNGDPSEQRRAGVPQIVKPDSCEFRAGNASIERLSQGVWVNRRAVLACKHEPDGGPRFAPLHALVQLVCAVSLEYRNSVGVDRDRASAARFRLAFVHFVACFNKTAPHGDLSRGRYRRRAIEGREVRSGACPSAPRA